MKFSEPRGDRWALYDVLEDIAFQTKPKAYLEIGVSRGDSLKSVLAYCTPNLLVLADSWGGESGGQNLGGHGHITDLLNRFSYSNEIIYLDGDSHETIPDYCNSSPSLFDLVLVDGDHSDEGAAADLANIWPLVREGGYVVFDDVAPDFFHPGLLKVWDNFINETGCIEIHRNLHDVHPPHTLSHGVVVGQKI